jgi:predicted nucleic acid-binding Zn ribbon protein
MPEENNDPINSLPEYEVRTMEDDINKLERRPTDLEKPKSAPTPTPAPKSAPKLKPAPLPPKPLPTKPLPPPIDISPPETLPIVTEKPVTIEAPIVVERPIVIEKPKIEIKKAPLPGIEDFIIPTPPSPTSTPTPIKVEAPIIIDLPKPKVFKSERPKKIISPEARKQRTKRILTIFIIVLVIIALGLFFYWQGTKPEPIPTPLPSNEISIPSSLIPADETKILKIDNNVSLDDLLRDESMLNQQPGTIKRIVPVKNEKDILPLSELLKELEIAVYPYVLSELNDNYNLIIYSQGTEKNIGLIIQTNNPNNVKEQAKYWEVTMVDDLKNLFLFKKPGDPTTKSFKENLYNDVTIHYINFPSPDLTIDYAISGNLFILSTSRESMYSIIDRLK